MLRKKIASILLAVVMIITAAFFVPGTARADELGTPTDSVIISDTSEDNTETDDTNITVLSNGLPGIDVPMNGTVGDGGADVSIKKRPYVWGTYISATGTEKVYGSAGTSALNVDNHSFYVAYDTNDAETIAYCIQGSWRGPDENGVAYPNESHYGLRQEWGEDEGMRRVWALVTASKFLLGGGHADPNADCYLNPYTTDTTDYFSHNPDDGGTFGTYYTTEGVVRGLMVGGKVYPMTEDEARSISSVVAHSIADHTTVTSLTGKQSGNNLMPAYEHIMGLASYSYLSELYDWNELERIDEMDYVKPYQSFTWQIYDPESDSYISYTSNDELDLKYADTDGKIILKVDYKSYNICNNFTRKSSSGNKTVEYNYSEFDVGDKTDYFNYFTVDEESDNTVAFTVSYDKIAATTERVSAGWNASAMDSSITSSTEKVYYRDVFTQTAYVTVDSDDLIGDKKLSISANTETATTSTPFYNSDDDTYAAKIFSNGSYQDMAIISSAGTVSLSSEAYLDVTVNGSIKIHKYSSNPEITDNNKCYDLTGANFGVFKTKAQAEAAAKETDVARANANAVAVIVTDKDGNGEAKSLPIGTYYVTETKAAQNYRRNNTVYTANITDDTPVTFNVPEEPGNDPAEVIARKKDANKEIYLKDAVFVIKYYDIELSNGNLVDPATLGETPDRTWYLKTNENGYASLFFEEQILENSDELYYTLSGNPTIPVGTITIQEQSAPEGYIKDDTVFTFSITDNPTGIPSVEVMNERTIPNETMKQPFEIIKYGETKDGSKNPLAGAGFSVCNVEDLKEVSKDYKPADGEVIVTSDVNKYYIWNASKAVVLTTDGKTELFTDSKGYAKSIDLDYGKYIGMETTVPANFLPVEEFTINVTKDSRQAIRFEFTDESTKFGEIRIHKTGNIMAYDEKEGIYKDEEIVLEGIKFGIYANENIYSTDGKNTLIYKKGDLVETVTTDANGDAASSDTLPLGSYRVHEENVPEGYIRVEDEIVVLDADDDLKYAAGKVVYETVSIVNVVQKAQIKVYKTNEDKTVYLKDAEFGLFIYDDKLKDKEDYISNGVCVATGKTDEKGELMFDGYYPLGKYSIIELKAPKGYLPDANIHMVEAKASPDNIEYILVDDTFINTIMKQPFEIIKYGETKDGSKNPLAGAGFSVCNVADLKEVTKEYEPADGEVIVKSDDGKYYIWDSSKAVVLTADGKTELITDSKGYAKSVELEYGKYIGMETTVPATFLPVDEFTINVVKDSREAIKFEFTDKLILTGRIDIHKTGEDRTYNEELGEFEIKEIVLEGIQFEIYAEEDMYDIHGNLVYASGTLVETITTDKNGDASTSDDLPLGKYRVHEKNVPAGFKQMKDEYVILSRECETVKVTDENGAEKQIVYKGIRVNNECLIPEIRTTAKDSVTLNNVADPSATTTSIDTVSHINLIPGQEYEIKTVVMDQETGKVLVVDGKEISATTTYKPTAAVGTVDISVTYNSQALAGKKIVFFEYIYMDGELIALHADINDEGQTITFQTPPPDTPPDTPPTGDGAPIGFIVILMILAGIGLISMICFKKLPKRIK